MSPHHVTERAAMWPAATWGQDSTLLRNMRAEVHARRSGQPTLMLIKCVYLCLFTDWWWLDQLKAAVVQRWPLLPAVSCNLRPEPSGGTCGDGPRGGNDTLVWNCCQSKASIPPRLRWQTPSLHSLTCSLLNCLKSLLWKDDPTAE